MLTFDLTVFLLAFAIAAASPGPGLAAIVTTVLSQGARHAVWFSIGVAMGDLIWLALSLGGLSLIAQKFHLVFIAVKWIGVAYLLFLAWKIWSSPMIDQKITITKVEKRRLLRMFAGLSITMGNPKAMLFYIALLPNLIDLNRVTVETYFTLSLGVLSVLGLVFGTYILLANKARAMFTSTRSQKMFNRTSAIAMSGAAAWIASK